MARTDPLAAATDPAIVGVNRMRGRSVLAGRRELDGSPDPWRMDLGGEWQFQWIEDLSDFDPLTTGVRGPVGGTLIPVPGVWQLEGDFGVPYYLANTYPPMIGKRKGRIPDIDQSRNEAGVYSRTFELPATWQGERVSVVFEGVKAGLYLFLNDRYLGYTQGSFLPAEFDLSDHVVAGSNRITAVVIRFTDGTYLEDQDMWFLSGIFRPVWLHAEPVSHIRDLWVKPRLEAPYVDGHLDVEVDVVDTSDSLQVDLLIRAPGSDQWRPAGSHRVDPLNGSCSIDATIDVPGALTWTAETPHLYEVAAVLRRGEQTLHVKSVRSGVRSVEIADEQILINGRPVVLKGVNRHDFDPDHGWAVPNHRYRHDLVKAKQLNINAIRCSHYPSPQILYDLADELGLYVMDECDLETHGVRRKNVPGDNPEWTVAVVDRMERMVLADRNHPSIIMWSLGNEAGLGGPDGGNFVEMRHAALRLDDSRPFHYEGDHNPVISDVVSRMYATAEQMAVLGRREELKPAASTAVTNRFLTDDKLLTPELLAGRPVILCEYAHAMENSLGNFGEYIDVFYRYRNLAGGFIWDYVDQSIHRLAPDGTDMWLYGGDFGEKPSHRYFCANGILAADRSEHPAAREVFWGYRNLVVDPVDPAAGAFRLTNRFDFTPAADFTAKVEVRVDGEIVRSTEVEIPAVPPGEATDWFVAESVVDAVGEILVRFTFHTRSARPWAEAGTVVAFDEFLVHRAVGDAWRPRRPIDPAAPTYSIGDGRVSVAAGSSEFEIDLLTGHLVSWADDGDETLRAPLRPNYWRALTDNDRGFGNFDTRLGFLIDTAWRDPKVAVMRFTVVPGEGAVRVVFGLKSRLFRGGILRYDIASDGSVIAHHSLTPRKDMVRLGFTAGLGEVTSARWYGKGPHENYVDRLRGAWTAVHELPLAELGHDYMRPQENGNRCRVRWAEFAGPSGGLRAEDVTGDWLGFTAWPFTQEALDAAEHIHELTRTPQLVTVNVDRQQRGVGGDTPGVAQLLPEYRMPAGSPQEVTVRLRRLAPGTRSRD